MTRIPTEYHTIFGKLVIFSVKKKTCLTTTRKNTQLGFSSAWQDGNRALFKYLPISPRNPLKSFPSSHERCQTRGSHFELKSPCYKYFARGDYSEIWRNPRPINLIISGAITLIPNVMFNLIQLLLNIIACIHTSIIESKNVTHFVALNPIVSLLSLTLRIMFGSIVSLTSRLFLGLSV